MNSTSNFRRGLRLLPKYAVALLLLNWLCLAVAGSWDPLHAWLHGASIPDNDHCPVAALQQGNLAATAASSAVVVVVAGFFLVVLTSCTGFMPLPELLEVSDQPSSQAPRAA